MGGFSDSENNAAVRGYILRSLVKGYHFSCLAKELSNKMISSGLIGSPDISGQLYYLEQCNLIEFTNKGTNAFSALDDDAVIRLTAKGIRYIENGGNPEMGIDL